MAVLIFSTHEKTGFYLYRTFQLINMNVLLIKVVYKLYE